MPCDTIQTTSVELKISSTDLLAEGLAAIGYQVVAAGDEIRFIRGVDRAAGTFRDGVLSVSIGQRAASADVINEIKRAHSVANVRATARRFGWQLADQDATHFVATKRGM